MTDKPENPGSQSESAESLRDLIDLPRVKILSEDETSFLIEYEGHEMPVVKSEATYFEVEATGSVMNGLRQELRLVAALDEKICQDDGAREFMEVMLFHELREREYLDAGFENPHQRAVHDEILYVMAHLSEKQREYLEFAKRYREERAHPVADESNAHEEQVAQEADDLLEQRRKEEAEKMAEIRIEIAANDKRIREESQRKLNEFISSNPDFVPITHNTAYQAECVDLCLGANEGNYDITVWTPGVGRETIASVTSYLKINQPDAGPDKRIWEDFFAYGKLELPEGMPAAMVREVFNLVYADIMKTRKIIEKMAEMGFEVEEKDNDYAFIAFKDQMNRGEKQFISIIFEMTGDTYWTSITVNKAEVKRCKKKAQSLGKKHGAKQVIYEEYDHNEANAVFKFDLDELDNAVRLYQELKTAFKAK